MNTRVELIEAMASERYTRVHRIPITIADVSWASLDSVAAARWLADAEATLQVVESAGYVKPKSWEDMQFDNRMSSTTNHG